MDEYEAKHFSAMLMFRQALGSRPDALALDKASELLRQSYALKREQRDSSRLSNIDWENSEFAQAIAALAGLGTNKEAMEIYEGLRPGRSASADPRWLLSQEVSTSVREARLVLWWNKERFLPAIWCPNLKTAFYARALLDIVGTKSFRLCAFCGDWFRQKRTDQDYCSVAHREAHRVARWRANQKLKIQKKGRKRGTRKTR